MNPEIATKITQCLKAANIDCTPPSTYQTDGLPNGVLVGPDSYISVTPDSGTETIVVTATTVQRFAIRCPFNFSSWNPVGPAIRYDTPLQMVESVKLMIAPPRGCW